MDFGKLKTKIRITHQQQAGKVIVLTVLAF